MNRIVALVLLLAALGLSACGSGVRGNPTAVPAGSGAFSVATAADATTPSGYENGAPTAEPTITPRATASRVRPLATATPTPPLTRAAPTRTRVQTSGGFRTVTETALPPEARTTLRLISAGGPFPYRQDGVVFQNRERLLPIKPNGFYHEYTVPTPGSPDRGARRIITGANGELYYTDDHYSSFRVIVQP